MRNIYYFLEHRLMGIKTMIVVASVVMRLVGKRILRLGEFESNEEQRVD
jgi:hypothetical protein